jgi:methyl-accepting chemotaxis protein
MIKINDTEYDAKVVVAQDGTMSVTFLGTSQTLSDIEALFNSTPRIEVWEDNELIATYFNKEITSLNAKKVNDLYNVTIYLRVSKLEISEEKKLQTQIDNLLDTVNSIKESNTTTDNAVDELGTVSSENASLIETLSEAVDDLATLVAELVEASQSAETETSEDATTETTTESEEVKEA